ncbi:red/farred photochromic bili protein photoreceptor [Cryphonectria parasitica EP155]|uniref:Red/farred photochromic bili protein photoreceptor n=1 Tax=Cryphonectria parasitica (strain ATCC 38755 / EP155) TaxID=660469 RepID=A0A9P5CJR1_CRYP1|nr:red/farred photochromic bili protein photoreceptor [Cryphonectria parasitica EP155]KAF3761479.1 red/farred photochromic bili protein photoreceptor [Cryphonectria parasitica EP155]
MGAPNRVQTPSVQSSWSAASDRQLGYGSQTGQSDRVFPIRSVISVEPPTRSSTDQEYFPRMSADSSDLSGFSRPSQSRRDHEAQAGRHGGPKSDSVLSPLAVTSPPVTAPSGTRRRKSTTTGARSSVQADAERQGSQPLSIFANDATSDDEDKESDGTGEPRSEHFSSSGRESAGISESVLDGLTTTRFKHVMTDDGHLVITGTDGTLQRCEDEPIHTPGAVQSFGLLLAIREEPDGRFTVRYASENSKRIIGYSPMELFRLSNFTDVLTEEQADNLLDHIDFIRDEDADPAINGPEVFSMSIRPPKKRTVKLWCAIHVHPAHPDLVICEFELDDDHEFPLRPDDERTPDVPEDTLRGNPTMEELADSTEISSKPLRVLRSARKRRGEAGAMQVFDIMSQVQDQLASAPNLDRFLKILVGIVKELTGFHRVMIYQFDASFNGKVVTELVDPTHTRDLYKGLHFPASDIPKQARDLYKLNKVRLLYDRDQETARLVCRSKEDLEVPLDMTHSYLRAMSPIHLKYLGNMAVRSSMSISINAFNELWGLIACHSYGSKGMRVSFPIRKMCRLVGDTVSRNIERLSYASRLQARKLINTVPTDKNPSGYIIASSDDLLKLFDADFGMLSIKGETKIMGKVEHSQEALAMLEYLRLRKFTSVLTTQDVKSDFPDLRYPPGFHYVAGLLYVPLSVGGHDFIVFFRKGQVREVKWAGNPYEKVVQEGTQNYLEPRKSFQVWHETVLGKCREWSEEQIETAAVLCLVYGKFIEVWRQKEAALQNSRLTRLLLANSAHEVRTPLNAIINYLEIALEGSLDQETRDNLSRSHSASKSLIYVINDLLDLTMTEEGNDLVKDEIFDLQACINEATDPFKKDASRKGIGYEVFEHPGLPQFVYGDQRKVRQAIANVTANAVEHTSTGSVRVEYYCASVEGQKIRVEIVVEDTGRGMSDAKLDALFRDLEQVSTDADEGNTDEALERSQEDVKTLGLGLAVVSRIIRNMDGQLRLKSEDGKGSRFVIQLPFEMPPQDSPAVASNVEQGEPSVTTPSIASVPKTMPAVREGELMLIDRGPGALPSATKQTLSHSRSFDESISASSLHSVTSLGSGVSNKSDADRLIDAIQTTLSLGEPESEAVRNQRRNSKGAYYRSAPKFSTSRSLSPSDRSFERPTTLLRSVSSPGKGKDVQVEPSRPVGMEFVTDVKMPIRPVKVPDDYKDQPEGPAQSSQTSGVVFEVGDSPLPPASEATTVDGRVQLSGKPGSAKLQVLVAEDDPVNMKILRKRLEKAGHTVYHTVNGEDCAAAYKESDGKFDVVLMDMQMPIVDGRRSTEMIRAIETAGEHHKLSALASNHGRIPVFAVSASLVEREKDTYMTAGFDGWILKPIDFKRLEYILFGIIDDDARNDAVYVAGQWERGGWFRKRLELPPTEKAKNAPSLRDVDLKGNEINAARESMI